jgi:23S rRNA (uridine2552-2'-O)-methyltransferase
MPAGKGSGAGSGARSGVSGGRRQARRHLASRKQRSASSRAWLERQLNDPYVSAARREGFRSRAAYKLAEIDDRFRFLKPGRRVVDLGSAPGGWSQVAAERVRSVEGKGQVAAIDLLAMEPIAGVESIELDFMDDSAPARLKAMLRGGRADAVLSDMAAPGTGHARTDHLRIIGLAEAAAEFASEVLEEGGTFVCKVLQGGAERGLLDRLKRAFAAVRHVKPPASRAESAEMYVVATGFRAVGGQPPR